MKNEREEGIQCGPKAVQPEQPKIGDFSQMNGTTDYGIKKIYHHWRLEVHLLLPSSPLLSICKYEVLTPFQDSQALEMSVKNVNLSFFTQEQRDLYISKSFDNCDVLFWDGPETGHANYVIQLQWIFYM